MTRTNFIRILPVAAFIAVMTACGGGASDTAGGGGAPAATTPGALVSSGAITGFGSVHLNGERFDTTSTVFTINGQPGTQDDLRVGHMIRVRGHRNGNGNPIADRIEFRSEVRGPVQSIDAAANTLVVLGQTVAVDADTSFDDSITGSSLAGIKVGDVVEISGARRADGSILATRIEADANGQFKVRGLVSALDAATHKFSVNALVVDYSTATLTDFAGGQPANGDLVEVEGGTLNAAGELVARKVEKEGNDDNVAGDKAEIEGLVTRFVSATDFDVMGHKVTTTSSTVFENGAAADLALNVKVEAEGAIDANGVLVATKVSFRRRGDARIAAPVDSVNATAGTLVVLGIDVTVNAMTRVEDKGDSHSDNFNLSNLAAGDWVELRGAETGDNDVTATRLERRRSEDRVRLRGVVDSAASPTFSVLGVTVQTTGSTRFEDGATLANLVGRTVSIQGIWMNGVLTAREVEFEDHGD